jgi:hypothetical protein
MTRERRLCGNVVREGARLEHSAATKVAASREKYCGGFCVTRESACWFQKIEKKHNYFL